MKIIKLISLAVFLYMGSSMYAQDYPISLTVHAGGNLSDMDVESIKTNPKVGYRGGVGLEFNLPKSFFLQTGIDITTKGAKLKWSMMGDINGDGLLGDYAAETQKVNMTYFVLPIKGGYRLDVSNVIRMNLSLGPYFGYGIGGKSTFTEAGYWATQGEETGGMGKIPQKFYNQKEYDTFSKDELKKFDVGLAGNIGIEYSKFLLNVGYEYGFINHSRSNLSSYNNSLYLTVGYRIL